MSSDCQRLERDDVVGVSVASSLGRVGDGGPRKRGDGSSVGIGLSLSMSIGSSWAEALTALTVVVEFWITPGPSASNGCPDVSTDEF